MSASVYILRCSDGAYYVGLTRLSVEKRVAEHNAGKFGGYTTSRRPVSLVFSETFERTTDAISVERKLKGWSRAKKEALIAGDFALLKSLSKRGVSLSRPHAEERALARVSKQGGDNASFETRSSTSPQDEENDLSLPQVTPIQTFPLKGEGLKGQDFSSPLDEVSGSHLLTRKDGS